MDAFGIQTAVIVIAHIVSPGEEEECSSSLAGCLPRECLADILHTAL